MAGACCVIQPDYAAMTLPHVGGMAMITLLHLSDLHFLENETARSLALSRIADVAVRHSADCTHLFIVISGDLSYSGNAAQFDTVLSSLTTSSGLVSGDRIPNGTNHPVRHRQALEGDRHWLDHMERPVHLSQNSVDRSRGERSHLRKEAGPREAEGEKIESPATRRPGRQRHLKPRRRTGQRPLGHWFPGVDDRRFLVDRGDGVREASPGNGATRAGRGTVVQATRGPAADPQEGDRHEAIRLR
jgi:hypothetical protein